MNDLISKKELIKEILDVYEHEYPTASGDFDKFVTLIIPNIINNIPTVDIEDVKAKFVKHGYWKRVEMYGKDCFGNSSRIHLSSKCSICGHGTPLDSPDYCPNCGAKMDGGNNR